MKSTKGALPKKRKRKSSASGKAYIKRVRYRNFDGFNIRKQKDDYEIELERQEFMGMHSRDWSIGSNRMLKGCDVDSLCRKDMHIAVRYELIKREMKTRFIRTSEYVRLFQILLKYGKMRELYSRLIKKRKKEEKEKKFKNTEENDKLTKKINISPGITAKSLSELGELESIGMLKKVLRKETRFNVGLLGNSMGGVLRGLNMTAGYMHNSDYLMFLDEDDPKSKYQWLIEEMYDDIFNSAVAETNTCMINKRCCSGGKNPALEMGMCMGRKMHRVFAERKIYQHYEVHEHVGLVNDMEEYMEDKGGMPSVEFDEHEDDEYVALSVCKGILEHRITVNFALGHGTGCIQLNQVHFKPDTPGEGMAEGMDREEVIRRLGPLSYNAGMDNHNARAAERKASGANRSEYHVVVKVKPKYIPKKPVNRYTRNTGEIRVYKKKSGPTKKGSTVFVRSKSKIETKIFTNMLNQFNFDLDFQAKQD